MNRRIGTVAVTLVVALFAGTRVQAQVLMQPTPAPTLTAENETWYLNGDPITYAGRLYYPAGAQIFFNPNEMVRSGFYLAIPLYARTTIEPYSVVYAPLAGSRMQPYERPRSGELAGTAGSTPPALSTPAETVSPAGRATQSAGPPAQTTRMVFDDRFGAAEKATAMAGSPAEISVGAVGTSGLPSVPNRRLTRVRIGGTPQGTNAIFIELQGRRWYPAGPAEPIDPSRLTRVDDYKGFPVWADPRGDGTVFIPVIPGSTLAVRYTSTRAK
ncbi:MAG: hypothetical protein H0W08_05470 [Acidobacteria bacterium]|nr:hypothetical protein [Acidobacteriota bacterium]